jgi:hypothetical protein
MPKPKININWATQKAVSYSQYSIYKQCPYQWYLTYIKKESSFKPSIYLVYGTAMHETIQTYLQTMYDKSVKAADEIDMNKLLEERLVATYKESISENKNEHFSTKEELKEFLADGQATLDWFKKNRGKYFSKKNTELVGIEIPILQPVIEDIPNVLMNGSIDFIIYDKVLEKYTIYDIKTSTKGWTDYEKKDQTKINQILLYKRFYSKVMNVPEDKVDVMFFIVKRKVFSHPDYPTYRIQEFIPANGKRKVQEAMDDLSAFIRECFTPNAKYNTERIYPKNIDSCKFCPYTNKPDLCDKKV